MQKSWTLGHIRSRTGLHGRFGLSHRPMQRAPHSAATLQAAIRASCMQRGRVRIAALASWAHSRSDQLKKGHRRFPVKVHLSRQ
jgi:hypothetical protein